MASDFDSSPGEGDTPLPRPGVRTALSLILFIHLFCIFAALSGNLAQSPLQARLLTRLRPYTQLLNFDVSFVPFYLTHASINDVGHTIEVLPEGKDEDEDASWTVLPDVGHRAGERYKRYQRLAKIMAFYSQEQGVSALVAQGFGVHFLHDRGIVPKQIRCRRHLLQNREFIAGGTPAQRDPFDQSFYRTVYTATALVGNDGSVEFVKLDAEGQIARPESTQE